MSGSVCIWCMTGLRWHCASGSDWNGMGAGTPHRIVECLVLCRAWTPLVPVAGFQDGSALDNNHSLLDGSGLFQHFFYRRKWEWHCNAHVCGFLMKTQDRVVASMVFLLALWHTDCLSNYTLFYTWLYVSRTFPIIRSMVQCEVWDLVTSHRTAGPTQSELRGYWV